MGASCSRPAGHQKRGSRPQQRSQRWGRKQVGGRVTVVKVATKGTAAAPEPAPPPDADQQPLSPASWQRVRLSLDSVAGGDDEDAAPPGEHPAQAHTRASNGRAAAAAATSEFMRAPPAASASYSRQQVRASLDSMAGGDDDESTAQPAQLPAQPHASNGRAAIAAASELMRAPSAAAALARPLRPRQAEQQLAPTQAKEVPLQPADAPAAPWWAESERLAEVRSSMQVVAGGHPGLDSITQLCAQLYKVPITAINLIDEHRLAFVSVAGPLAKRWGTGTDRAHTFCEALLLPQVHTLLCVPDTARDHRFRGLSCVAEDTHVRFYAGTPLVSSRGHRIGSLCLFDLQPRRLSADALNLLAGLGEMAARLLEAHKVDELEREQGRRHAATHTALQRAPGVVRAAALLCDTSARRWPVLWSNVVAASLTGLPGHMLQGSGFFEVFVPEGGPTTPPALQQAARQQRAFTARVALPGSGDPAEVQFSPASKQLLEGAEGHPLIDVSVALTAAGAPSGSDVSQGLYFAVIQQG